MENTKVRVTICGGEYLFTTDENPEYVKNIAEQVDHLISDLMRNNGKISFNTAAVYAAVVAQDSARQERLVSENLRAQIKEHIAESARCRSEAEEARREVDRLRGELIKRDERIAELSTPKPAFPPAPRPTRTDLEDQTHIELPSGKLTIGSTKAGGISPDEFINMIDTLAGKKEPADE